MSVAFPNAGLGEGLPLGSTTMVDHSANRIAGGFDDIAPMGAEEAAFHRANFAAMDATATAPAELSFFGRLGAAFRGLFGLGTALGLAATAMSSQGMRNALDIHTGGVVNQAKAVGLPPITIKPTNSNTPVIPITPLPKTMNQYQGNYPFFVRRRRKHPV